MTVRTAAAAAIAALALSGCSTVLDGFGTSAPPATEASAITPAPTASVESAPVAPPAVHGAAAATAGDAVTPRQPGNALAINPPLPSAPGGVAYSGPGAARAQLAGSWTFSWDDGRKSCPVTLTTERGMTGLAASGDVTCPNEIFMTKVWDLWDGDIVLQNHLGKVTARLKPAGPNRFDGTVTADGGGPVSLVR